MTRFCKQLMYMKRLRERNDTYAKNHHDSRPCADEQGRERSGTVEGARRCLLPRLATDTDEQATSYEAQIEHYTTYIQINPAWSFAGIYADEGISGTSTKKREAATA